MTAPLGGSQARPFLEQTLKIHTRRETALHRNNLVTIFGVCSHECLCLLHANTRKPCTEILDQGKTLYDVLMDIYVEYGFSKEVTVNVVKPGKSGADEIKAMMDNFRACPPKELGGSKVVLVKDYKTLTATDGEGKATPLDMPEPSNVLQFFTEDGTKISVRPSGTEPKIKFYMEIKGEMHCPKCYAGANADAMEKVEAIKKSLGI